jgi:cytidylate kinase
MKEMQLNHEQAEQLITRRDYEHDTYLRRYYGSDGHQPSLYHLLINTSLFSFEMAADVVRQALPLIKKI